MTNRRENLMRRLRGEPPLTDRPEPPSNLGSLPPVPDTRRDVLASLRVAKEALGHQFEHIGRIQWLIDAIERGEGDVAWYLSGMNDAAKPPNGTGHYAAADQETYARIYMSGMDDAAAQGLMGDPVKAEEYLEARFAAARAEPKPIDLGPFEVALSEIEDRMRRTGGGVQDAYHNAAGAVRSAFRQYEKSDPDTDPRSVHP